MTDLHADLRHDIREPENDGTVLVNADDVAALLAGYDRLARALDRLPDTVKQRLLALEAEAGDTDG
jgi:hypothetical protein